MKVSWVILKDNLFEVSVDNNLMLNIINVNDLTTYVDLNVGFGFIRKNHK